MIYLIEFIMRLLCYNLTFRYQASQLLSKFCTYSAPGKWYVSSSGKQMGHTTSRAIQSEPAEMLRTIERRLRRTLPHVNNGHPNTDAIPLFSSHQSLTLMIIGNCPHHAWQTMSPEKNLNVHHLQSQVSAILYRASHHPQWT